MKIKKVLIASPEYNQGELRERQKFAEILLSSGYQPLFPGFQGVPYLELIPRIIELGYPPEKAELLARAITNEQGIFKACRLADATLLNLNGRIPDEGSIVLATYTFASGKPVVVYKQDGRTPLKGRDSPLVEGLGGFKIISDMHEIVKELDRIKRRKTLPPDQFVRRITLDIPKSVLNHCVPETRGLENICRITARDLKLS